MRVYINIHNLLLSNESAHSLPISSNTDILQPYLLAVKDKKIAITFRCVECGDIGDKVKMVKGNPFGKVGIMKFKLPVTGPVDVTNKPKGLDEEMSVRHFEVKAEGQLELLE